MKYIFKDNKYYKQSLIEVSSDEILKILNSNVGNFENSLYNPKYIIAKIEDKDLKEWMYNYNGYTYMKWNVMMEWAETNPHPWYHIPTIEEMKKEFKGKKVKELQKEIWFKFSGFRRTDWGWNLAGIGEDFWSCSPTSDKDSAHCCCLTRGSDSPDFDFNSREYGFGVLLFKDKSSD